MSRAEKVLVLARGVGSRMRKADAGADLTDAQAAVAETGVKAMIPIGRPFLDYVLSACADAGVHHACLVIGPEHQLVRDYYASLKPSRIQISFAVQTQPLGTANAVASAEQWAADSPFLMLNSDNYYPVSALQSLVRLNDCGIASFDRHSMLNGSNIPPDRIAKFAIADVGPGGLLQRVIEKPSPELLATLKEPIGVSMNCWRFDPRIFQACRKIEKSVRGEYEITDAVQYGIDHLGMKFHVVPSSDPVLDMSSRGDIPSVAARLKEVEVSL